MQILLALLLTTLAQILGADFFLYTIWRIHWSFVLLCVAEKKIPHIQIQIYLTVILQPETANNPTVWESSKGK